MKQIRTTIESPYEPNDNGALWLDTSNPDAPILKAFTNGKWQATIGGEKVTEIGSDSTDEEIPTAKAVNDRITALADEVGVDLDKYKEYFTIEAIEDHTTVYFRQSNYAVDDGLALLKVDVSTDNGETWTEVTAAPAEDDVPGAILATLDAGDKVLIRGNNPAYGYHSDATGDAVENCNFWADIPCYVYGNIMSLVSKEGFETLRSVNECAFTNFFSDYDAQLDWTWVMIKDGAELLLPATTLARECYNNMFAGCTSLTNAPTLPATSLAWGCYSSMFQGCSNLSYIKALFTTTPSSTYTQAWVQGVNSTGTFVKSENAGWSVSGDNGVPSGWTIKEAESTGNVPVTTAPMSLTERQKEQVRENIDTVRPIKMLSLPVEGDDLEDIFNAGMTLSEIEAASRGKRNGVIYQTDSEMQYMPILEASYGGENYWRIEFCSMDHTPDGTLNGALGRYYRKEGNTFIISSIEI